MLEAKIVLRAVLASADVRPAEHGVEVARRRNITIRPARGTSAVLRERNPAEVTAA